MVLIVNVESNHERFKRYVQHARNVRKISSLPTLF